MKKRKILKRALPAFLAVMLILSVFVVGASALSVEELGLCECVIGQQIEINQEEYNSLKDVGEFQKEVLITCDICGVQYACTTLLLNPADFDGASYVTYRLDVDSWVYCIMEAIGEDGAGIDGDMYEFKQGDIRVVPRANDGSIVGDMANSVSDTIGGLLQGIGHTVISFFDKVVLGADGGLSTLATWTLVLLGVSFGLGAIGFVIGKVRR